MSTPTIELPAPSARPLEDFRWIRERYQTAGITIERARRGGWTFQYALYHLFQNRVDMFFTRPEEGEGGNSKV